MVHMDQGSTINFDVEEKQINLGRNLFFQEMSKFNDEFSNCEQESVRDAIPDHSNIFFAIKWMDGPAGLYCLRDRLSSVIVFNDD